MPCHGPHLLPSLLFGAATGLRATVPMALLTFRPARRGLPGMLRRPRGLAALRLAALGELVADKLPSMPSRLMPPGLLARACLGALGGGALARIEGSSEGAGAVMGALAALAAAAVGFSVRRYASRATRTPDVPWALVEDGACLLVGAVATR